MEEVREENEARANAVPGLSCTAMEGIRHTDVAGGSEKQRLKMEDQEKQDLLVGEVVFVPRRRWDFSTVASACVSLQ